MKLLWIEKIGSIGSVIAAAACPACFPLLAVVGTTVGLWVLRPFEGTIFVIFRILVLIALIGNIFVFFNHRRIVPLITGILSPLLIFFTIYIYWNTVLLYTGLSGLIVASVMNYLAKQKCKSCQINKEKQCNLNL